VLATIGYGFHINFVSHYLADVRPLSISSVAVTMAGLLAFCFVYLPNHEKYQFTAQNFNALLCLLILGVAGTAIAQFLNTKLIAISSSLFASTSTYIIPIVAVFWGIYDGETLTIIDLISMAGVLAAVLFIRQNKKSAEISK
jgi:drug/metabolite transporter (DMT)-like permease